MSFLAVEPPLIARIKASVPSVAERVFSASDLQGVLESAQFTPAVQVFFRGYRVTDRSSDDCAQVHVEQDWMVIAAVNNRRRTEQGGFVREDASPILSECIDALLGFKPAPLWSPLILIGAPAPSIDAGYGYFPLQFKTGRTFAQA